MFPNGWRQWLCKGRSTSFVIPPNVKAEKYHLQVSADWEGIWGQFPGGHQPRKTPKSWAPNFFEGDIEAWKTLPAKKQQKKQQPTNEKPSWRNVFI